MCGEPAPCTSPTSTSVADPRSCGAGGRAQRPAAPRPSLTHSTASDAGMVQDGHRSTQPGQEQPRLRRPSFPACSLWAGQLGSGVTSPTAASFLRAEGHPIPFWGAVSPWGWLDGPCCPAKHFEWGRVGCRPEALSQEWLGWGEAESSARGPWGTSGRWAAELSRFQPIPCCALSQGLAPLK